MAQEARRRRTRGTQALDAAGQTASEPDDACSLPRALGGASMQHSVHGRPNWPYARRHERTHMLRLVDATLTYLTLISMLTAAVCLRAQLHFVALGCGWTLHPTLWSCLLRSSHTRRRREDNVRTRVLRMPGPQRAARRGDRRVSRVELENHDVCEMVMANARNLVDSFNDFDLNSLI